MSRDSRLSHVRGGSEPPLLQDCIGARFDAAVARWAERPALVAATQGISWSYRQLALQVDGFAAGLLGLGLAPGERVGIWSHNNAEWVVAQLATAKAGLILVTINPAYRGPEAEYVLNRVGCRAVILGPAFKSSDYAALLLSLAPELASCRPGALQAARLPALRLVIAVTPGPGMLGFQAVAAQGGADHHARLRDIAAGLGCDQAVNIQFTSGTTGHPKGATLSHHNILNNGFMVGAAIGLSERDRLCIPVPFYHCFGMVMGNLAALSHGACMVIPGAGFDAGQVLQTVAAQRCTALYGVPSMFIAILNHPDFAGFDLTSLRTGIMAGSPCPVEVMRQVIDRLHMPEVTIAYGMTETSPVSFQSAIQDPIERRVASVGRVHPHVEAKIVDDRGVTLPRGEVGELLTRGYSVMQGYWDDAPQTAAAIDAEGWMHTRDLAALDEAGYCRIHGRIKDMVIRGGENIYPREVEEFLYRHPKIRDAQLFGIPDRDYGEVLCAWIIVKDGHSLSESELVEFCRDQIAHYKIPSLVRFVEAYPMTVSGKIQKYLMRQQMIAELGLDQPPTA